MDDITLENIQLFNTHRPYTSEGQRIAYGVSEGKTYFADVDRKIYGVIHAVVDDDRELLRRYDAGGYDAACGWGVREQLSDFVQQQTYSGEE